MKVIAVFVALLAVSLAAPSEVAEVDKIVEGKKTVEEIASEEEKQNTKREYGAICRASTGATQEQITAIGEDAIDDAPKAVKCYIKCLAEQYGIEKDHVLQKDVALRHRPSTVTAEEFETITETCAEVPETDDPCDSAYLRYSCFFRTSGKKIRIA